MNKDYKYNYNYYIRIYSRNSIYEYEILNNIAFNTFYEFETDDPNEDFFVSFNLEDNENYILSLFIKVNGKNNEEQYYSKIFEINTKTEKSNNNKTIIILCIIFGSIFIITLIILFIVCAFFKSKNKNLLRNNDLSDYVNFDDSAYFFKCRVDIILSDKDEFIIGLRGLNNTILSFDLDDKKIESLKSAIEFKNIKIPFNEYVEYYNKAKNITNLLYNSEYSNLKTLIIREKKT